MGIPAPRRHRSNAGAARCGDIAPGAYLDTTYRLDAIGAGCDAATQSERQCGADIAREATGSGAGSSAAMIAKPHVVHRLPRPTLT